MIAPPYAWTCHKCQQGNPAGSASCVHCQFPAVASAVDVAKAKGEPDPITAGYKVLGKASAWFAFLIGSLGP